MTRERACDLISLAALAAVLVISSGHGDDWTSSGPDAARTHASAEVLVAPFSTVWSAPTGEDHVASAAAADGRVVIASRDAVIRCYRETDGALLWSYTASALIDATPAVERGVVYVPDSHGTLYALNLANGALLWTLATGGSDRSSPYVSGSTLYMGTAFPNRQALAVNALTGALLWQTNLGEVIYGSPALSGSTLLMANNTGTYYALDAATGAVLWSYAAGGEVWMSSPLVVGSSVYALRGGTSVALASLNVATGAVEWTYSFADPLAVPAGTILGTKMAVSSPMSAWGKIVFLARFEYSMNQDADADVEDRILREYAVAVDPATQGLSWQISRGTYTAPTSNDVPPLNMCPTPARVAAGIACPSSLESSLKILSTVDGTELSSVALGATSLASPATANGRIYQVLRDGRLFALQGVNAPPAAPAGGFSPVHEALLTSSPATLSWGAAADADTPASQILYKVRIDNDGEVLRDWLYEFTTTPGTLTVTLPALADRTVYTWAVRAQDDTRAWSPWSSLKTFYLNARPPGGWPISIGGLPYDSLEDAAAAALSGDTITLGVGTFYLNATVPLREGVTLRGNAPHLTKIDGTGLDRVIRIDAGTGTAVVQRLTVSGGNVGIDANGRRLEARNVIFKTLGTGLRSPAGSTALAVNVTFADNTVAAASISSSSTTVRSSIAVNNAVGFICDPGILPTLTYNDVYATVGAPYVGCAAGTGSIDANPLLDADLREAIAGPAVDTGDPEDDYRNEPQPNGRRVNMGAFGNTEFAGYSIPGAKDKCHARASTSVPSAGLPFFAALLAAFLAFLPRRRFCK